MQISAYIYLCKTAINNGERFQTVLAVSIRRACTTCILNIASAYTRIYNGSLFICIS